jgi:hypothetical protein
MPIFSCGSCGRLLFAPADRAGQEWRCATCGPIVLSSEPTPPVNPTLLRLLEEEYRRTSPAPAEAVLPHPPAKIVAPRRGTPNLTEINNPTPGQWVGIGSAVVLVFTAFFAGGFFVSMPFDEYCLKGALWFTVGAVPFSALLVLLYTAASALPCLAR